MASTFDNLLEQMAAEAESHRGKGTQFERVVAAFLRTSPYYANLLDKVWLWDDWPANDGPDNGIDIVARERETGDYWALQCKCYRPGSPLNKADVEPLIANAAKAYPSPDGVVRFSKQMFVTTTDNWTDRADRVTHNQSIEFMRLGYADLSSSPVDWDKVDLSRPENLPLKRNVLRAYQEEAVAKGVEHFRKNDRGRLIMACGTGKTFVALNLMGQVVPQGGLVLFLAPSIALVSQSLREWTAQADAPIRAFAVCSDSKAGRPMGDLRTKDLPFPATTDAAKLAGAVAGASEIRGGGGVHCHLFHLSINLRH